MTSVIRLAALCTMLAGPTALAFFTGGYFDTPRLVAALAAWVLVLGATLAARRPLPRATAGRVALAGLALLTAWSAASFAWAPLSDPATQALERLVLYLGGLVAAGALLRGRRAVLWCEPALAAGATIVVGYGLAGRLLPGVIHQSVSITAAGRLEQPLTYWNAMGALAAIGLLLAARVAGAGGRPRSVRCGAAAATVILALGLYLSFSRGALAAFLLGALVLLALELSVVQVCALGIALLGGGIAAGAASALSGVRTLQGSLTTREGQGAVVLGVLVVLCLLAVAAQWYVIRIGAERVIVRPRHTGAAVTTLLVALFVGLVLYTATDKGPQHTLTGANPARLGSLQTNRYAYWRVALVHGFAPHPVIGVGAGGFGTVWLRYRNINERVKVAHSLYVETLAELGLVGFSFLVACFGGLVAAARRAYAVNPAAAAGPAAVLVVFATHVAVDWDWEMPALTLFAVGLAGLVIGLADEAPAAEPVAAREATSPAPASVPAAAA